MPGTSQKLFEEYPVTRRYEEGLAGEQAAETYLVSLGMTCLTRRFRGGDGEIDLVMDDHGVTVFVEVKFRPSGRAGEGLLAVTPAKQRHIAHAAGNYLLQRDGFDHPIRFDVVEITSTGLKHVPNAFQPKTWD